MQGDYPDAPSSGGSFHFLNWMTVPRELLRTIRRNNMSENDLKRWQEEDKGAVSSRTAGLPRHFDMANNFMARWLR
jgi:hypothetical protein